MRLLLVGGRLSVMQPRTDDKEAPMNRHVEDLTNYLKRIDDADAGTTAGCRRP
jgi:hypothetical protein